MIKKPKGIIVFLAALWPTLLDEQLHSGHVLRVPASGPTPVPPRVVLSQGAHHHGVRPLLLVAAGDPYAPFVGFVHEAVQIHQQGAAGRLPPAQVLRLVAALGVVVAPHRQRASHHAAQELRAPGPGGGCRLG